MPKWCCSTIISSWNIELCLEMAILLLSFCLPERLFSTELTSLLHLLNKQVYLGLKQLPPSHFLQITLEQLFGRKEACLVPPLVVSVSLKVPYFSAVFLCCIAQWSLRFTPCMLTLKLPKLSTTAPMFNQYLVFCKTQGRSKAMQLMPTFPLVVFHSKERCQHGHKISVSLGINQQGLTSPNALYINSSAVGMG